MWIIQALVAMICFSFMTIIITNQMQKGMPVQVVMFISGIIFAVCFGLWTYIKGSGVVNTRGILMILVAGALAVIGNWGQFNAAANAPNPGYAMALVASQAAFITILGKFMLNSELTPLKITGVAVVVIGIIIIITAK